MGIVYEAGASLGRRVALKVLPASLLSDPRASPGSPGSAGRREPQPPERGRSSTPWASRQDPLSTPWSSPRETLEQILRHQAKTETARRPMDGRTTSRLKALISGSDAMAPWMPTPVLRISEPRRVRRPTVEQVARLHGQHGRVTSTGSRKCSPERGWLQHATSMGSSPRLEALELILDERGCLRILDFGSPRWKAVPNHPHVRARGDPIYMSPEQAQEPRGPWTRDGYLRPRRDPLRDDRPEAAVDGSDRSEIRSKILHQDPVRPRRLNRRVRGSREHRPQMPSQGPRQRFGSAEASRRICGASSGEP